MRLRFFAILAVLFSCGLSALLAFQARFGRCSGGEDSPAPMPGEVCEPAERTFARLRNVSGGDPGYNGEPGTTPADFPEDRQIPEDAQAAQRGAREIGNSSEVAMRSESAEQVIGLVKAPAGAGCRTSDAKLYVIICCGAVSRWRMISTGRSHGTSSLEAWTESSPVFHTVYDLDQRVQAPGLQYLYSG